MMVPRRHLSDNPRRRSPERARPHWPGGDGLMRTRLAALIAGALTLATQAVLCSPVPAGAAQTPPGASRLPPSRIEIPSSTSQTSGNWA